MDLKHRAMPNLQVVFCFVCPVNVFFSESIEIFKNISVETGTRFVDFQDLNFSFTLDKFLNQDHITPQASSDFAKLAKSSCFD